MESKSFPTFQIPPEELVCSIANHSSKAYEFVCTKRECENRLACAQCLLENHSAHFQWMVVLEEFFNPKQENVSQNAGEEKYSMQDFIKDREGLIAKFETNLTSESEKVRNKLAQFQEKWLQKFHELEQQVTERTEKYRQNFIQNIEIIQSYTSSSSQDSIPKVIKDTQDLQEYLDQEVSKENDLREKKLERTYQEIVDNLNALHLMDFDKKKAQNTLTSFENLLDFSPKTDAFEFYKKSSYIPSSKLDETKLICKRTLQTTHKKPILKVLPFDDENKLITCSDDNTIMIYDFKSGEPLNTLIGHSDRIWSIIRLRNGNLASCSNDNSIKIWNVHKGICEKTLTGHSGPVRCLVEFPNLMLLSGSHDKTLKLWDLKSDSVECVRTIKNDTMGRIAACIVTSLEDIAFGSEANIRIINLRFGTVKQTLRGHKSIVRDLLLLENEPANRLLSASEDKTIMMWNVNDGTCLKVLNGHNRSVNRILPFNNSLIASASDDGTLKFWDVEKAESTLTLSGHTGWVSYFTILTNGSILSCGEDKTIKVWGNDG